jgi:hypothetical protein
LATQHGRGGAQGASNHGEGDWFGCAFFFLSTVPVRSG